MVASDLLPPPPPPTPSTSANVRLVVPPPEIRTIVDKTAQFVAKHGKQAESRIAQNQKANTKFSFLISTDPYNAYYLHRVKAYQDGTADSVEESKDESKTDEAPKESQVKAGVVEKAADTKKKEEKPIALEPPAPEQFIIPSSIDISPLLMDVMKLTAMFVARNGDQFKIDLQSRERAPDSQFDFLDSKHSFYPIFELLVNSYRKILNAPESMISQLKIDASEKPAILKRVSNKSAWEKKKSAEEKARGDAEEREREIMSSIDWRDFVIVETIDFEDNEELSVPEPHPLAKKQSQTSEPIADVDMDMDESTDEVAEPEMKIVSGYVFNPPKKTDPSKTMRVQICPNCHQSIPIDEMEEHLRIELLDPKWREQQQIAQEKKSKDMLADDTEIAKRLGQIAVKRPDIFGSTIDEVERISQEDRPKKSDERIWDGHSDSITRTASAALTSDLTERAARGPVQEEVPKGPNIGPSISQPSSQGQGFRPTPTPAQPLFQRPVLPAPQPNTMPIPRPPAPMMPPMMMAPGMPMMPFPPMPGAHFNPAPPPGSGPIPMPPSNPAPPIDLAPQLMGEDDPSNKRQKIEANLVPEADWIRDHPGSVSVSIQVPNDPEKGEWQLHGQVISLTFDIKDTIKIVKDQIATQLNFPANKQKLALGSVFLKDEPTLAYYNVASGAVLSLGVKERGGRGRKN
eukprot:TRINITY_DN3202_c0_g2_i1.p1 TRINITY_DN3202_c0_g2~~TRINITY_DN3202_c0_g2_i1.p1  ORF type:complete len:687 (+),score=204.19 TRINITY_DN3202_c0_g2_i1:44-2104(+)